MKTQPTYWSLLLAVLVLSTLGGCASAPEGVLSRQPVPYAALPNGYDPLNPDRIRISRRV
jgi:hypothetical protein